MNQTHNTEGKACPPSAAAPILGSAQPATAAAPTAAQPTGAALYRQPVTVPSPPPEKNLLWAVLASYPLSVLYVKTWFMHYSFLGDFVRLLPFAVFCIAFFAGVDALFRAQHRPRSRQSKLWLGIAACFFVGFAVTELLGMAAAGSYSRLQTDGWYYMSNVQLICLHVVAAYWVLCRAGLCAEATPGALTPLDLFDALLAKPIGNLLLRLVHLWQFCTAALRRRKKRGQKRVWQGVLTLAIAVPVFFTALKLLLDADANFAEILYKLRFRLKLPVFLQEQLIFLLLGLPVGAYLYGLVAGAAKTKAKAVDATALRMGAEKLRFSPRLSLAMVMCAFLALYAAFFVVQAGYLLGGFRGQLPQGFTAAAYAREGFFQLCAIVVLNFCLLALAAKISHTPLRNAGVLKGLALCLMGTNLLFAAVSCSKLYLYICRFGLTLKRVQSAWFTLVLVVFTGIAIATLLKPFSAIKAAIYAGVGLLLAFCISQPALWAYQPVQQPDAPHSVHTESAMATPAEGSAVDTPRYAEDTQAF